MERDIEQIIKDNQKLVYHVLNRHYPAFISNEDFHQAGLIGLWKACVHFDESKCTKFSTFASKCILNEIRMEFRVQSKFVDNSSILVSLDEPLYINNHGEEITFADQLVEMQNPYGEIECDLSFLKDKIKSRNFEMFKRYAEGMTQAEIAREFNCSRSNVNRVVKEAKTKITRYIHIEDFT